MAAQSPGQEAAVRRLDLCDADTARAVARRAGLHFKRRYGQHLLVDRDVLDAVVDALDCSAADEVYEVGPGIGTLTVELSSRARSVVSVELDEACVRATKSVLGGADNVRVVHGDALRCEASDLGLHPGYLMTGNIPYTITGALLTHVLESPQPPRRAVFMVQREVAARLSAPSGDWSLATVAVRSLARVERLRDVAPASFEPPPAVHSSIVRLVPDIQVPRDERDAVLALARAAFQQRRKVLRHGISHALGDEPRALAALAAAGIDPRRRPGTLELEEWRRLARAAAKQGPGA
jgi:16S rRNA (adenine1518-N6/adenine1519-N6)-dimethyltransferase